MKQDQHFLFVANRLRGVIFTDTLWARVRQERPENAVRDYHGRDRRY